MARQGVVVEALMHEWTGTTTPSVIPPDALPKKSTTESELENVAACQPLLDQDTMLPEEKLETISECAAPTSALTKRSGCGLEEAGEETLYYDRQRDGVYGALEYYLKVCSIYGGY